jgi:hypothetical protein
MYFATASVWGCRNIFYTETLASAPLSNRFLARLIFNDEKSHAVRIFNVSYLNILPVQKTHINIE